MPPCRVQRRADGNARQGKAVGVCRGTLLGGTRTEIQDRKGRGSSDERPHGRDEIGSCHRPKARCRVVQGAVRQAKTEHTPPHAAAKERQGNEIINNKIRRSFSVPYLFHRTLINNKLPKENILCLTFEICSSNVFDSFYLRRFDTFI